MSSLRAPKPSYWLLPGRFELNAASGVTLAFLSIVRDQSKRHCCQLSGLRRQTLSHSLCTMLQWNAMQLASPIQVDLCEELPSLGFFEGNCNTPLLPRLQRGCNSLEDPWLSRYHQLLINNKDLPLSTQAIGTAVPSPKRAFDHHLPPKYVSLKTNPHQNAIQQHRCPARPCSRSQGVVPTNRRYHLGLATASPHRPNRQCGRV